MKSILLYLSLFAATFTAVAQHSVSENPASASTSTEASDQKQQHIVRITGVRFVYPLLQNWIDGFNKDYPDVQVIIESRGSSDPSHYDILIEAYEHPDEIRKDREYLYIARYAVLPVANSQSAFAKIYSDKGLNKELIKQLFFHNIFSDKGEQTEIKAPFTVYTRLQKAGVPVTFSHYYGFEQKDIKGKAIAGADEHLLKAIARDSTALSYAPLPLIYDQDTGKPVDGLTILPVDLNGNGRVSDDEKFYNDASGVTSRLEESAPKDIQNVPIEYIHLSVDRKGVSTEAILFLQWVINNGQKDLHSFGYLNPEPKKLEREKFEQFASRKIN